MFVKIFTTKFTFVTHTADSCVSFEIFSHFFHEIFVNNFDVSSQITRLKD